MFLIEKILFFLLLLLLPTQFGKHFWPSFSLVLGQRIDYLSPTLYVTDILIGLLLVLQIIKHFRFVIPSEERIEESHTTVLQKIFRVKLLEKLRGVRSLDYARDDKKRFLAFFTLVFLSINIFFSQSPIEGLYGVVKVLEVAVLIYYTGNFLRRYPKIFFFPLVFGIISESVLAISQFFTQSSIGGIFYYFGERTFTSVTPGIANASINGQLVLRPYGTFSHPNVLAGYFVLSMTMIGSQFFVHGSLLKKLLLSLTLFLGTIGLLFTLSRVAILVWLFVKIFFLFRNFQNKMFSKKVLLISNGILGIGVVLLFTLSPLHPRFSQLTLKDESIVLREQLTEDAFRMMFARPVLGVGLNNFLIVLPHYDFRRGSVFSIQPVHNIFLLIGAETGFVGFWLTTSFVIWMYIKLFNRYKQSRHPELPPTGGSGSKQMLNQVQHDDKKDVILSLLLLTEMVILGSFDHYFLTLQQGQLLLGLVVGFFIPMVY